MLWNLQKTRPLWTFSLNEAPEKNQEKPGQLFNPPLAHCISAASCGNVFACAAEDGCVHLARVGPGSRLRQYSAFKAHTQGVSQAHFLGFMPHPYWLATGGNDGMVALWDVSREPGTAAEVQEKPSRCRTKNKKAKSSHEQGKKSDKELLEDETGHHSCEKTGPVMRFSHEEKVNWVCPAQLKGKPCLLVADQRDTLSVYSLPEL